MKMVIHLISRCFPSVLQPNNTPDIVGRGQREHQTGEQDRGASPFKLSVFSM